MNGIDRTICMVPLSESPSDRPVILNELDSFLASAIRVVVKSSPWDDTATLFESTDKKDLEELQKSLLLKTPAVSFYCMCIGSPALYLYKEGGQYVLLTNHHSLSVRCSLWTSNVWISDPEKWLSWFDRRGITDPRQEFRDLQAQWERAESDWNRWLAAMPKAITPIWKKASDWLGEVEIIPIRADLERNIPDERDRIITLLEWFGSGTGPWSYSTSYETVVEELLLRYPTASIVQAIESSGINQVRVAGAARLFGGCSFAQRRPNGLKEVPDDVKRILLRYVRNTKNARWLNRAMERSANRGHPRHAWTTLRAAAKRAIVHCLSRDKTNL